MFGDLLATSLMARGVRGLITDAGVRDTADLRSMGFPVWAQHVSCQGTVKNTAGSVNVPVVLGGVTVQPGDVVCADDDGVVIVKRADAERALERSDARLAKEEQMRVTLRSGELGVDLYGLRQKLNDMGVEYIN
jgi:4-hydroxy-4-methyl-2-oxoglutarate aldolase